MARDLQRSVATSKRWTADLLARRLYISNQEAGALLSQLASLRALESLPAEPARYVYRPATTELGNLVDQLAETYRKQLVSVSELIHSNRQAKIQQFADAFRITKEEP